MTSLRIAMLGLRGVPATYGGIERHVEEIGARLAAMGHDVTVFCRTNYAPERVTEYRGMRLRYLPTIGTKHLDAIVHTALASAASIPGFDVHHYHALGPGLLSPLSKYVSRAAVVQTIHGLDHERAKWGRFAKRTLSLAERMSARVPDETIVISKPLADHYRTRFGRATTVIPNGVVPVAPVAAGATLARHGLTPGRYLLFVGRLVPEKAPHLLVEAFAKLEGDLRLAIVGGSSFSDEYVNRLRRMAASDSRIVFTGYAYGEQLAELYTNAAAFVSPSTLEAGPPLTMLEALSFGIPVVVSDIPTHMEALDGDAPGTRVAANMDVVSLVAAIRSVLVDREEGVDMSAIRERTLRIYDWDASARRTAEVYARAVGG